MPPVAATPVSLDLPATSANLGPGFDALALALDFSLRVEARSAEQTSVTASGRSPEVCGAAENNLLLTTYRQTWSAYRQDAPAELALTIQNEIPLGMGCGSSAASRAAGVALACHFGALGWSRSRILDEVAALEHHPDNAAACLLGGFTAAGVVTAAEAASDSQRPRQHVIAVTIPPPPSWRALLVLPGESLATTVSRAVLPETYTRAEIVPNLQNASLLVAAFAQSRGDLLLAATRDRMHQPFRAEACPLLTRLLPLAGHDDILSVTLSGAGSGVLLLLEGPQQQAATRQRVREAAGPIAIAELLETGLRAQSAGLPGVL